MTTNMKLRLALTTVVALASFFISFTHIVDVAMAQGNALNVARCYPITIDAMILVCALTLVANAGVSKMGKLWASVGRIFGFTATIYCNLAASHFTSVVGAIINMIPALSLIITVELMVYGWKATPATRSSQARKTSPAKATAKTTPAKKAPAKAASSPAKLSAVK